MNMANESLARNEEIVDGVYPLGALIRRSVGGAIYETEFGEGEDAVPAVIKIREGESAEAENLIQRLWNVTQLAHPNLLKIYATGSSTLNGGPIFYVVMEQAEESLETVLTERALTASETLEMLVPTLDALGYLHKNGYAHSHLRPSNVLAVNDQLKLSTDSLIQVTDGGAAEDLRALGVVIVHALGQKIQDVDDIPQPLLDIVRHCLDPDCAKRWTVEQVQARLSAPDIAVEKFSSSEEEPKVARLPKWTYAALAALILSVILLVAIVRSNDSAPAAAPVAAVAQPDLQAPPDLQPPPSRCASKCQPARRPHFRAKSLRLVSNRGRLSLA